MYEKYINVCLKIAMKAYKIGEVPVGCVIVDKNTKKIISCGYNTRETKNNVLYHAEIIAINNACKKKKSWRLDDCFIVTTLEPCLMCMGAIIEARIGKLIYGTKKHNSCLNKNECVDSVCLYNSDCANILSEFFKKIRSKH